MVRMSKTWYYLATLFLCAFLLRRDFNLLVVKLKQIFACFMTPVQSNLNLKSVDTNWVAQFRKFRLKNGILKSCMTLDLAPGRIKLKVFRGNCLSISLKSSKVCNNCPHLTRQMTRIKKLKSVSMNPSCLASFETIFRINCRPSCLSLSRVIRGWMGLG